MNETPSTMTRLRQGRKILVVAATEKELGPLAVRKPFPGGHVRPLRGIPFAEGLVTGAGMLPTTLHLGRILAGGEYGFLVNIGVCTAFEAPPVPGDLVLVTEDRVYGLGAEGTDGFLTLREIGLAKSGEPEDGFFFTREELIPASLSQLRRVKGITVNTIHGWPSSINKALALTGARVESMEGAACMYAAAYYGIEALQLRVVAGMVGPRDPGTMTLDESLAALHALLPKALKELR